MALYNEIQVGRFNRYLQKLLGIKGGPPVATLSSDLQASYNIDPGAEDRYLLSWDLFGRANQVAAVAAQSSVASFRNPAGSNVVAVLTRLYTADQTAGTAAAVAANVQLIRGMTTDQNSVLSAAGWDARGRTSSTCQLSKNTGAPAATGGTAILVAGFVGAAATGYEQLPPGLEIPVLPGDGVTVTSAAVNTGLYTVWWWRERFLEESERT